MGKRVFIASTFTNLSKLDIYDNNGVIAVAGNRSCGGVICMQNGFL